MNFQASEELEDRESLAAMAASGQVKYWFIFLFNQLFDIVEWGSDAAIVRDIFPNEETETICDAHFIWLVVF